jgi:PAS domain S-box-containing protein
MADLNLLAHHRSDELPNDTADLRRCIRDLIALSTLPVVWKNCDPRQIADSVAGALLSMVECELVYISIRSTREEPAVEVARSLDGANPELRAAVRAALANGSRTGVTGQIVTGQILEISRYPETGTVRLAFFPIGSRGDAILAAASARPGFPNEAERALLGVGANQAAIAMYRWDAVADERRFLALLESSPDFVAVASLGGVPQYLNPAGFKLVGLDDLDRDGALRVLDFIAPSDRIRARDEIWPWVMQRGRWSGELGFRHFRTGATIHFLVDWFRIDELRTGRAMNVAMVARDLTAQKRSETELRQLNESLESRVAERTAQLAASNAKLIAEKTERERADARLNLLQSELYHAARLSAVGEMAAALAHELNQPLTAATISFNTARRLLARGESALPRVAEVMNEGAGQVLRGGQIIRRVRNFVIGSTEKRQESVAKMIEEGCALALGSERTLGVEVRLDLDPDASAAFADRIQIQQVLVNLLRNALEAMEDSARRELAVTTRLLDRETIEIAVADSGAGIAEHLIGHVFEPFVSTKDNGMGLGLSICRSIVEDHGGGIQVGAAPGGGTIFRFTLAAAGEGKSDAA